MALYTEEGPSLQQRQPPLCNSSTARRPASHRVLIKMISQRAGRNADLDYSKGPRRHQQGPMPGQGPTGQCPAVPLGSEHAKCPGPLSKACAIFQRARRCRPAAPLRTRPIIARYTWMRGCNWRNELRLRSARKAPTLSKRGKADRTISLRRRASHTLSSEFFPSTTDPRFRRERTEVLQPLCVKHARFFVATSPLPRQFEEREM